MTDKYQRLMAEFENARKRNAKEQSHMYDVGVKEVLAKLLPVVDNFERGLDALSEEEKEGCLLYTSDVSKRQGLKRFRILYRIRMIR